MVVPRNYQSSINPAVTLQVPDGIGLLLCCERDRRLAVCVWLRSRASNEMLRKCCHVPPHPDDFDVRHTGSRIHRYHGTAIVHCTRAHATAPATSLR